jgi:hypothetical protein
MTDQPGDKHDMPSSPSAILEELEAVLLEGAQLARKGEFEEISQRCSRIDSLLEDAKHSLDGEHGDLQPLAARVQEAYEKLRLSLAASRDGMNLMLNRIGQGKKTLEAYGNHAPASSGQLPDTKR